MVVPQLNLTVPLSVFVNRNILALLNAFDLQEGNITESNYDEVLQALNSTSPLVIQGLDLKACDMQTFLSQVKLYELHHGLGLKKLSSIQTHS